jgi:DNA invertase Pin-like site-specific DNA recombinase
MTLPQTKSIRCAIYTRKSTDHGLEIEFNSLDAQREACEAYIKSQAHEGWRPIPDHYDDPAYSGGSLDRPALQQLLRDIDAGKVNVIVVYKIDRLTRSLADFAKLVEIFDAKAVSFVAITQQFNTTTSMGRLTLNVLLSFAQFERELASERVRDKVAASRRRGKWTGGGVPLGYRSENKKLVVDQAAAETVRYIFRRYLDLGRIQLLADDLRDRGIRTKRPSGAKSELDGGIQFTYGPLAHVLTNRVYLGEIGHKGTWFPGEHAPLVDRETFDQVQDLLKSNRVERRLRRSANGAMLTGLIFDDCGNRMSPSFSTKQGIRYFFYVSAALLRGQKHKAGSLPRVSADALATAVMSAVRRHSGNLDQPVSDRELLDARVERIVVGKEFLKLELKQTLEIDSSEEAPPSVEVSNGRQCTVTVPWSPESSRPLIEIDERASKASSRPDPGLVQAIVRAQAWIQQLSDGTHESIEDLAAAHGMHVKVVRKAIRLGFLAPDIVAAILAGDRSPATRLSAPESELPLSWAAQRVHVATGGRAYEIKDDGFH